MRTALKFPLISLSPVFWALTASLLTSCGAEAGEPGREGGEAPLDPHAVPCDGRSAPEDGRTPAARTVDRDAIRVAGAPPGQDGDAHPRRPTRTMSQAGPLPPGR